MFETSSTDFDEFCAAVEAHVRDELDLTAPDLRLEVGFPSSAFPIAPERLDASATMSAINHDFINLSSRLRKTAQTKLLMQGLPLTHLTKVNIAPGDIVDGGDSFIFRAGTE